MSGDAVEPKEDYGLKVKTQRFRVVESRVPPNPWFITLAYIVGRERATHSEATLKLSAVTVSGKTFTSLRPRLIQNTRFTVI